MPELKTYDLFISHAWKYGSDYYGLVSLLTEFPYFRWRNYSVPKHDPLIDPKTIVGSLTLKNYLDKQIRPVNCVLVAAGMYVTYREWIQTEIDIAKQYDKPIIGVIPWGQQRVPQGLQEAADELVRWNTGSIVTAIRKWAL
jgi:hypothetical protein